jgi:hypothetical protein
VARPNGNNAVDFKFEPLLPRHVVIVPHGVFPCG